MRGSDDRSSDRIGGASGIMALALSLGGFALIGAAGFALEPGAAARDVAGAVSDGNGGLALAGIYLDILGSLLFVVFAACLWARLRRVEGDPEWMSLAAFAALLLMIAAGLGDKAAYYAIFSRADDGLDVDVAASLYDTATGFFTLFNALSGLFVLVTGAAIRRTGALPRWLGTTGVLIGLAAIASAIPESSAAQAAFPLVALWIVAVSIALIRERASHAKGAREPASAPA
jgi:hypothetical protein